MSIYLLAEHVGLIIVSYDEFIDGVKSLHTFFFFTMRFKVEKLKVALECAIKDKSEVDTLIYRMFKDSVGIPSFTNIPGSYEYVRLTYTNSTFKVTLLNKSEDAPERLSCPIRINVNPNKIIKILTDKSLNKFVSYCRLNLASAVPKEQELMSIDYVRRLLGIIESKAYVQMNDEGLKFDSDVPARRLKILFGTKSMVINAGMDGKYRFEAEYDYLGDNYCVNIINRFTKALSTLNKGTAFGKGGDYESE